MPAAQRRVHDLRGRRRARIRAPTTTSRPTASGATRGGGGHAAGADAAATADARVVAPPGRLLRCREGEGRQRRLRLRLLAASRPPTRCRRSLRDARGATARRASTDRPAGVHRRRRDRQRRRPARRSSSKSRDSGSARRARENTRCSSVSVVGSDTQHEELRLQCRGSLPPRIERLTGDVELRAEERGYGANLWHRSTPRPAMTPPPPWCRWGPHFNALGAGGVAADRPCRVRRQTRRRS